MHTPNPTSSHLVPTSSHTAGTTSNSDLVRRPPPYGDEVADGVQNHPTKTTTDLVPGTRSETRSIR